MAAVLGLLMNTRGLTALIVINVGKDLGILPDGVFGMLVLMAIVTTFMTTPGLPAALAMSLMLPAPPRSAMIRAALSMMAAAVRSRSASPLLMPRIVPAG